MFRQIVTFLGFLPLFLTPVWAAEVCVGVLTSPSDEVLPLVYSSLPMTVTSDIGPLKLLAVVSNSPRSTIYEGEFENPKTAPTSYPTHFVIKVPSRVRPDFLKEVQRGYSHIESESQKNPLPLAPKTVTINGDPVYMSSMADESLASYALRMAFRAGIMGMSPEEKEKQAIALAHQVLVDVVKELADYAELGLAHNDIKPENILYINGKFGLSDFDSVTRWPERTLSYSPLYASRDFLAGRPTDTLSDLYSLAITLTSVLVESQNIYCRVKDIDDGEHTYRRYVEPDVRQFFENQSHILHSAPVPDMTAIRQFNELKEFIEGAKLDPRKGRRRALANLISSDSVGPQIKKILDSTAPFERVKSATLNSAAR